MRVNDEYPRKVYEALSQLRCDLHKLTVIIEPRRVISEDYGYLFSNMSSIKERKGTDLITILALGTCARSAQYHENRVPQILSFRDMSGELSLTDAVGSNCYEHSILVRNMSIPLDLSLNDKFMLPACGSYDIMNASDWIRTRSQIIIF
ncbi:hypothetical protein [Bartonella sp. ML70XJBT]|uniref:hypothetical protein n=1 Tax=Bartonella sp. ML70XJBT TaxID=3019096 RepID=UPI00235FD33D|nr:hypothetical protein [Bartonella sp. ML70XJBT]